MVPGSTPKNVVALCILEADGNLAVSSAGTAISVTDRETVYQAQIKGIRGS